MTLSAPVPASLLCSLLLAAVAQAGSPSAAATARLAVSPSGHYFTYAGRTIALVGDSGTQCVMQDANIDYRRWIDDCAAAGLTAIHIWAFVPPRQRQDGSVVEKRYGYVYPGLMPWPRRKTGPLAADGLRQYDLQHFDEGTGPDHYWSRLRDLCRRARDRGLVVGITVFFGWPKHQADWLYHPLNVRNGGPVRDDKPIVTRAQIIADPAHEVLDEAWSDAWPVAKKTQWIWERYADKMIRDTNHFGNVFYVFMDEHSYSEGNCGDHFERFFRSRGALWCDWDRRRADVDVVMSPTFATADRNAAVVKAVSESPARPYLTLEGPPYLGDGVRVSLWGTLLGGGNFIFADDSGEETPQTGIMGYDPHVVGGNVGAQRRDWLGYASRLMNRRVRFLDAMRPHNELCEEGAYCLADPGREYVVYVPPGKGGEATLRLAAPGPYTVSLYNPRTGQAGAAREVTGGVETKVALPDAKDWVIHAVAGG